MAPIRVQVVIAGAGPTGTVAALRLALNGIDVAVFEPNPDCARDLRASTFHPPTLEMLAELDIVDELLAAGLRAPVYQYRDRRSDDVFAFDMSELADVTRYPFRLQCEQYIMARLIADRLEALESARLCFEHRLVHYEQDAVGVVSHIETPTGIVECRSDFLIGADGANSIVRKRIGTEFEGFTYPERFLTMSTDWPVEKHFESLAYVNYVSDPDEWCVLLRVPRVWRILVPVDSDASDVDVVGDANKNAIFTRLIGVGDALQTDHRTIYRVHQRVAQRFVVGRVVLIGDAAHLNNPLGGFGMNSGIHDAWNLTGKLLQVFAADEAPAPLLERYERQRKTVTLSFIQEQTMRNKRDIELGSAEAQQARRDEMQSNCNDDGKRREFMMRQSMIRSLEQAAAIQ